jgi:PTS system fructose-specific IIC component
MRMSYLVYVRGKVTAEIQNDVHLKILQILSRRLMDNIVREYLISVGTIEQAYELLRTVA